MMYDVGGSGSHHVSLFVSVATVVIVVVVRSVPFQSRKSLRLIQLSAS